MPDLEGIVSRALREFGRITRPKDLAKAPSLIEPVVGVADYLLGETLAALAYAPHLGDPEGLLGLLGPQADVSHRHRFGFTLKVKNAATERVAWQRAGRDSEGGGFSFIGSLFGLDMALAAMRLRRLATDAVPEAPRLSPDDAHAVIQTLALMNPRDLASDVSGDDWSRHCDWP